MSARGVIGVDHVGSSSPKLGNLSGEILLLGRNSCVSCNACARTLVDSYAHAESFAQKLCRGVSRRDYVSKLSDD